VQPLGSGSAGTDGGAEGQRTPAARCEPGPCRDRTTMPAAPALCASSPEAARGARPTAHPVQVPRAGAASAMAARV